MYGDSGNTKPYVRCMYANASSEVSNRSLSKNESEHLASVVISSISSSSDSSAPPLALTRARRPHLRKNGSPIRCRRPTPLFQLSLYSFFALVGLDVGPALRSRRGLAPLLVAGSNSSRDTMGSCFVRRLNCSGATGLVVRREGRLVVKHDAGRREAGEAAHCFLLWRRWCSQCALCCQVKEQRSRRPARVRWISRCLLPRYG